MLSIAETVAVWQRYNSMQAVGLDACLSACRRSPNNMQNIGMKHVQFEFTCLLAIALASIAAHTVSQQATKPRGAENAES